MSGTKRKPQRAPTERKPAAELERKRERAQGHYTAAEAALIRGRGAPCLTCNCSDADRATCEAW